MNVSLSMESFPLSEETARDMRQFLDQFNEDCRTVLGEPAWQNPEARGFAVVAYTEEEELKGFATAIDIVGLRHFEWSVIVSPDIRRQSVGTALVEGIQYGLKQREAQSELAAFLENNKVEAFMASLGYEREFLEFQLAAPAAASAPLPEKVVITPLTDEIGETEKVLTEAFDEDILPVLSYNIEAPDRQVWVMKKEGAVIASATTTTEKPYLWVTALGVIPTEQRKGYGQTFLKWFRQLAGKKGLSGVMLDVETDNAALQVYEKAGFAPAGAVAYYQKTN